MDSWLEYMLGTMDDLPVHTTPNHHLPKIDTLPTNFF